ncbi:hypothetical protein DY245_16210 [Streptomyces inhibens]|uniref:Uncharacterized protein n=1 Tax=Streptomyces inhibens TaxID=2293571 RepID=A0A371Q3Q1_STRIH|nr:hypothetical protein [Streptomyces inhibens]REK89312.1 hypothetical protein DY245_16210 [Streptomyces inhibens]
MSATSRLPPPIPGRQSVKGGVALLGVPFVIGLGLVPVWMSQRGGDANPACDGKAMRVGDICNIRHGALGHHYT